jgi:hypothetical protein
VYNPKIEGIVTKKPPEELDKTTNKDEVYVIVK